MLSIFATTEYLSEINRLIATEHRLSELVKVFDLLETQPSQNGNSLVVDSRGISHPLDWHNDRPPYLLPEAFSFDGANFLGLVFDKLGNGEKAYAYFNEKLMLRSELGLMNQLQFGYQITKTQIEDWEKQVDPNNNFEQYRLHHNKAVIGQYGFLEAPMSFEEVREHFLQAVKKAPHPEWAAFTIRQYATLLIDSGAPGEAVPLLNEVLDQDISKEAQFSLKAVLTNGWMEQLSVPYDPELLEKLKNTLWETLQYFETNGRKAEAGLLLLDAAQIANISNSFSESLGYLNKAVSIFEEEELEELTGNAQLRKGTLLYTWAQNGNPQFFKPAIESYQQALKVFRQDVAADVFADIHHHLAVLYAEMPTEHKKKSIWAGVASTSFQEALQFFNKDQYPYQYGMICNNYGNALMKFPLAVHSDNYEKALFYYQEALSVRTPDFPYERAITLLNFLEASWKVSNDSETFNRDRFEDMYNKVREVKSLVSEPKMLEEADRHLALLTELEQVVSK